MQIVRLLLDLGGGIFLLLGLVHALYTFLDISRPRRLVPDEPAVARAMAQASVRLSRGGTTMWRAWVGFNFSHSLGAIVFGAFCIGSGAVFRSMAVPAWLLFVFVVVAVIYMALSVLYWFRIPTLGIALATTCLIAAWLVYATVGV